MKYNKEIRFEVADPAEASKVSDALERDLIDMLETKDTVNAKVSLTALDVENRAETDSD